MNSPCAARCLVTATASTSVWPRAHGNAPFCRRVHPDRLRHPRLHPLAFILLKHPVRPPLRLPPQCRNHGRRPPSLQCLRAPLIIKLAGTCAGRGRSAASRPSSPACSAEGGPLLCVGRWGSWALAWGTLTGCARRWPHRRHRRRRHCRRHRFRRHHRLARRQISLRIQATHTLAAVPPAMKLPASVRQRCAATSAQHHLGHPYLHPVRLAPPSFRRSCRRKRTLLHRPRRRPVASSSQKNYARPRS